jgi:hypothetical protein
MGLNKYRWNMNEEPAGKFDIARQAGSKGAAFCQPHCVG